MKTLVSRCWEE